MAMAMDVRSPAAGALEVGGLTLPLTLPVQDLTRSKQQNRIIFRIVLNFNLNFLFLVSSSCI